MSNHSPMPFDPETYKGICRDIVVGLEQERVATQAALAHARHDLAALFVSRPEELAALLTEPSPNERRAARATIAKQRRVVHGTDAGLAIIAEEIAFFWGEIAVSTGFTHGKHNIAERSDGIANTTATMTTATIDPILATARGSQDVTFRRGPIH